MKKKRIIVLLITLIILLIGIVIFLNANKEESIISRIRRKYLGSISGETIILTDEIYDADEEKIDLLITIEDYEYGIKRIIYPDGLEIYSNNKTKVALDYTIKPETDYEFIIENGAGEQVKKVVSKYYTGTIFDKLDNLTMTSNNEYIDIEVVGQTRELCYNEEKYNIHVINYDGDLILDGTNEIDGATLSDNVYEFGSEQDVANSTEEAKSTVVLKVNGNLTINSGITLTTCKSNEGYGGPKGLIIYCTGTLENNGIISMTARGAKAAGQDVYLYKNEDNTFEYIPQLGAKGGAGICANNIGSVAGNTGENGTLRRTAGGGSGEGYDIWSGGAAFTGKGGNGTSYSGGTGSGACRAIQELYGSYDTYSAAGSDDGGAGGYSGGPYTGGGTGNPGGSGTVVGTNGTGGLLIISADIINNNGEILSNGTSASSAGYCGGSSGGGSINLFYKTDYLNQGTITATGGSNGRGGKGGDGCITIGNISSGTFVSDEI